jgi:hypothetical protein
MPTVREPPYRGEREKKENTTKDSIPRQQVNIIPYTGNPSYPHLADE